MGSITFFGGAGSVTGSKHLVEVAGKRILLDCGTFQGLDVRLRNRTFPFPPESIDAVVLSHAHLDHCGMLPLLIKRGFKGSIFCTPATADVARYILQDAAGIEVQDALYRKKHSLGALDELQPLFTADDIPAVMQRMVGVPYVRDSHKWTQILPGVSLKFYDAGHILGSAVSVLRFEEEGKVRHIAYTGDVGPQGAPLLHDPEVPDEEITTLLMESTYGNRTHLPIEQAEEKLAQAITAVCDRKGVMVVPAFSLGRTQMLVYMAHKLTDAGRIPRFPIFVDSPLATDITQVYKRYTSLYDAQTGIDFSREGDLPLAFRNLTYTQSVEDSKALNTKEGPFMVISASGMMTAGRIVHHLKNRIFQRENAIFITGYQATGTVGRRILEGAKRIELYGQWVDVNAQILLFNEFSAHADGTQLASYASSIKGLTSIALVHGEPKEASELQHTLKQSNPSWNVVRPDEGDTIAI